MDVNKLNGAMNFAAERVSRGMSDFGEKFPGPQSHGYVYTTDGGGAWTDAFWTGMLFLSYEYTGDKKYLELAKKNVESVSYTHLIVCASSIIFTL